MSYIHVSAAYSSRIYGRLMRRGLSRIIIRQFVQATYHTVPRTCDVPGLRSRGLSVTYLYSYGISLSYVRRMCYVRVTYVWRMKCARDVSTAYVLRSILICGVSVLYHFLFKIYENKRLCSFCSCNLHIISIIRGRRCHRRNQDNLD